MQSERLPGPDRSVDWLTAAEKRVHRTIDAVEVVIVAVERATMDAEHADLDDQLT